MKSRALSFLVLIALLLAPGLAAAQDGGDDNPVLRLLRFVPDTPLYREAGFNYGDKTAWFDSWGLPSPDSLEAFREWGNTDHWWNMIDQTMPDGFDSMPDLLTDETRPFYGFDIFNVDRYLRAGLPGSEIMVAEYAFDRAQIDEALTASGYEVLPLVTGSTLYRIVGDYERPVEKGWTTPPIGWYGERNRIFVADGYLITGRATELVLAALSAHDGAQPTLADNPLYVAAAQAIMDPALGDTGDLVGVSMTTHNEEYLRWAYSAETWLAQENLPDDLLLAQPDMLREELPAFDLVAFATRHADGISYMILALVFPVGTDVQAAAGLLADRVQNYTLTAYAFRYSDVALTDAWAFDRAAAIESKGLPVALVVLRAYDPPPSTEQSEWNPRLLTWLPLIVSSDLGFLATGPLPELESVED